MSPAERTSENSAIVWAIHQGVLTSVAPSVKSGNSQITQAFTRSRIRRCINGLGFL